MKSLADFGDAGLPVDGGVAACHAVPFQQSQPAVMGRVARSCRNVSHAEGVDARGKLIRDSVAAEWVQIWSGFCSVFGELHETARFIVFAGMK